MRGTGTRGFTLIEVVFAVLLSGILLLTLARLEDSIDRMGAAARSGADARALQWTAERVLRRALDEAGQGMASSPNLGGVGVRVASGGGGAPVDTLVLLSADGDALRVATRGCRSGGAACVVLVGDQRGRVDVGDVVVVGTRGTGFAALQVQAAPAVFYAPCAGDCPERLVCSARPRPAEPFLRVVGSLHQPGGTPSDAPCAQPYLADGSRCEEVVEEMEGGIRYGASCTAAGPPSAFTELAVADRTAALGFPPPPALLTRSGADGVPLVRAVKVRPSRFWVRPGAGADSVLVRQNGLDRAGTWRTPVGVAGPVTGLGVETLQDGTWVRGVGVGASDLERAGGNPNYVWNPAPRADGREAGSGFLRGHHRIAAVRVRYQYREASPADGLPLPRQAWIVVPTPALLEGGTGDPR